MASLSPPPLSVYYCYDPVDLAFSKALDVHLGPLKRNGWIHTWDDQQIPAGTEWEPERDRSSRSLMPLRPICCKRQLMPSSQRAC